MRSEFLDFGFPFSITSLRTELALDIDGVLANFGKRIIEIAKERFVWHTSWPNRWYEQNSWFPAEDDTFGGIWESVRKDPAFWLSLEPFYDEPRPHYTPAAYVTSRPIDGTTTQEWLEKWGFPDAPVVTVHNRGGQGAGPEKAEALHERRISRYIDDMPENFEDLRAAGIDCYLMDRPWNKHIITAHRVYTVNDI